MKTDDISGIYCSIYLFTTVCNEFNKDGDIIYLFIFNPCNVHPSKNLKSKF